MAVCLVLYCVLLIIDQWCGRYRLPNIIGGQVGNIIQPSVIAELLTRIIITKFTSTRVSLYSVIHLNNSNVNWKSLTPSYDNRTIAITDIFLLYCHYTIALKMEFNTIFNCKIQVNCSEKSCHITYRERDC